MLDDQRFASRRPDVLAFETSPLDADLRLAGTVAISDTISTTDADFVVKLIDVFPNDYPKSARANYPMSATKCWCAAKYGASTGIVTKSPSLRAQENQLCSTTCRMLPTFSERTPDHDTNPE
jgi:predicted acyl esterase